MICFNCLPEEISSAIIINLSSSQYQNTKLVRISFISLADCQITVLGLFGLAVRDMASAFFSTHCSKL